MNFDLESTFSENVEMFLEHCESLDPEMGQILRAAFPHLAAIDPENPTSTSRAAFTAKVEQLLLEAEDSP